MKVAVTGATGFIGRELLTRLVAAGHVAIPLVRREAGLPNERVVGDLAAGDEVRMDLRGVDAVVHLAGRAHVLRETAGDPLAEYRRINVGATERIAHASAAAGVRRVVMVSSIKVNGERTLPGTPFRFDDTPQPEDMYGRSKFEAEIAGREICGSVVGYTVIRPSMVYGFGARGNFERLVKLVRSGAPLPFGGLTNRRSMIHVGNLADLLVCVLESEAAENEIFLASDGVDVSTTELIRRLANALSVPVRLFQVPSSVLRLIGRAPGAGAYVERLFGNLQVDAGHTFRQLGWTPPYTLDEALARSVNCELDCA